MKTGADVVLIADHDFVIGAEPSAVETLDGSRRWSRMVDETADAFLERVMAESPGARWGLSGDRTV